MTQEDNQKLLTYLCMALPYNVYVNRIGISHKLIAVNSADKTVTINNEDYMPTTFFMNDSEIPVKPYLRPLSSMTEEEVKELLFVRLASKYGESCVYIKKFIKLNEISFRQEYPYKGTIDVWFSFENKIHDTPQIIEYSKCEHLGRINDITLAEIDWLNANHFDYCGLIPKGLAIEVNEFNNPYKN